GTLKGKDRLIVVKKQGDIGSVPGKALDQLNLNRVEVLGFINQDVSWRYGQTLLRPKFFEREKKKVIVVESWPLKSLIFLEKLFYLFTFFDQAEFNLTYECGNFSMVAVDACGLRRFA